MPSAFSMEPWTSTAAPIRLNSISEKYSGAPNSSATSASGGPNMPISTVPMLPAMNDATAAMPSAGPARPCFAIS